MTKEENPPPPQSPTPHLKSRLLELEALLDDDKAWEQEKTQITLEVKGLEVKGKKRRWITAVGGIAAVLAALIQGLLKVFWPDK